MSRIRKYLFAFIIVQIIILLLINGLTYARYVSNSIFNYYLKSKSFYFTSDYLSSNTTKNVNNFWNGESTHFNLKNSINQGAVSEADINYTVTCSTGNLADNIDCFINGTTTNTYTGTLSVFKSCVNNTGDGVDVGSFTQSQCEVGGYTYKNHPMEADLYFDLVPKNNYEISDVTVSINVTSSPYNKVLSGNFIIHKAEIITGNISSNYENYPTYDRLIITNSYLQNKCIKVSFNASNLTVDNNLNEFTSTATDANGYVNSFEFNLNAQSNRSYIFYKKNTNNYTISDFEIKEC